MAEAHFNRSHSEPSSDLPIKTLSHEEEEKLARQNSRLVSSLKASKLEIDAQKNWDLFYKRNETRFFKDRHWTTREFGDLLECNGDGESHDNDVKYLLEVGCGVGNLIFPLIEDKCNNYFMYACDFSPRAVELMKKNPLYDETRVKAFQCDITTNDIYNFIKHESLDYATLIFVLSAIHPENHKCVISRIFNLLKPGGKIFFRDYGLYDMAQIRFKPGHKISENFYMRQDGTRSYYFSINLINHLFESCGFTKIRNDYIYRRTVNLKENVDAPRIYVQSIFSKLNVST